MQLQRHLLDLQSSYRSSPVSRDMVDNTIRMAKEESIRELIDDIAAFLKLVEATEDKE